MLKTILSRLQRLNPLLFACMAGLIVIGVTTPSCACSTCVMRRSAWPVW
jgi:hypothetical protein